MLEQMKTSFRNATTSCAVLFLTAGLTLLPSCSSLFIEESPGELDANPPSPQARSQTRTWGRIRLPLEGLERR
jgi:hypothetical protein